MLNEIYQCIVIEHDYRLVLLAAAICLFASYTTMSLLQRAREAAEGTRRHWVVLTAISAGCGVWATHFVAMIAYDPGMNLTFDVVLTVASVLVAIILIGTGFALWLLAPSVSAQAFAGVMIGVGIASMHATGMTAVKLQGLLVYDYSYVALGVVLGVGFSIAACLSMRSAERQRHLLRGALLFTLAICGLHFTAMTAVSVEYDPTVVVPTYAVPKVYIVLGVTLAAGLLLAMTLASALIDRHLVRQFRDEVRRLRDLSNAAVEGVVLLDANGRILDANSSFLNLTGRQLEVLRGLSLQHCFRNIDLQAMLQKLDGQGDVARQAVVIHATGPETDVELRILQRQDFEVAQSVALVRLPAEK
ncbi:MAG: PAS domain S-box protein [Alphaproteobacteria bacterium]|nr:PAS domain S-box protein [Alphaproteobacteria bacterium]